MNEELVREAIDAAGGSMRVAVALKLGSDATVRAWIKRGVPRWHADRLAKLAGGKVQAADLMRKP